MKNESSDKNKIESPVVIGLLAHVDSGKTTLAESLLFTAGKLKKAGRVDHKDAFLDTHELEKKRGITIFSKQAFLKAKGLDITLLDTPGHVDFCAETERTLCVLDCGILIISASDGITGHVLTLWKLLSNYKIPVFIFVNKMDQPGADKSVLLELLKSRISESCIDFTDALDQFFEDLASSDEKALEEFFESGKLSDKTIRSLIKTRTVFPVFFGSALKMQGIDFFLTSLGRFIEPKKYPEEFSARVYKISRDEKGERLTHIKVTGGTLKVKTPLDLLLSKDQALNKPSGEKVNQIRLYDGAKYELADEAGPGCICALSGLNSTYVSQAFGAEKAAAKAQLIPVLNYQLLLPSGADIQKALLNLRQLEEEDPQLHIVWNGNSACIHIQVMGTVQLEILKSLISERFGLDVSFGPGKIIYKETIKNTVEGVGHFEPLRHYAEVHLLLEPLPEGSGMVFDADCSEDILDKNWQRLILTHLKEKNHIGILTGSDLTDIKITLKSGRAHAKHTEGGDFRQATYRAVRQGLMQAENVLLEPYYSFRLEVPSEMTGRALSDISKMSGHFDPPLTYETSSVITGFAPVSTMQGYASELSSYSRGLGKISVEFSGYEECHNADEVIGQIGYDPKRDTDNPSSSVFCAHGAGYIVPWEEVKDHMHLESILKGDLQKEPSPLPEKKKPQPSKSMSTGENELKEIFERTYGSGSFHKRPDDGLYHGETASSKEPCADKSDKKKYSVSPPKDKYLFVDGYNIIFAWDELKSLAAESIHSARIRLVEILSNYQAYEGMNLILVFDGYKVKNNPGETSKYLGVEIVFTKEGQSADQYIESAVLKLGRKADITVATSDGLEQLSIFSHGGRRMSAADLYRQVNSHTDL